MAEKPAPWPSEKRWLIAALAVAVLYSLLALRLAFHSPDLVQDDARQHVFWMQRYQDAALFPNDFIADYFQAVAPAGYKAIYWTFAKAGVDPLFLAKILPAIIGVFCAWLAFRLFLELVSDPRGAFFASVLLGQLIWFKDDVISATPRAFVYPLFLAFLLCLLQRRMLLCLLALALQGLVYPQSAFVSMGILVLRLLKWEDRRLHFSRDRSDYLLCAAGLLVLGVVLVAFAQSVAPYRPVITRAEALVLPEFLRHGRSQFFTHGAGFWLTSARAGLWPGAIPVHVLILAALVFPLFWIGKSLLRLRRGSTALLLQVSLVAIGLWAAAHVLLFKLHLPARYSQWAFRILLALLAAMTLAALFEAAQRWREKLSRQNSALARVIPAIIGALILILIVGPVFARNFPHNSYVGARPRTLFEFLRTQPKDALIATLRESASKIPVFAQRSVLVSAEHAIPYHQGYYRMIRERGRDLVRAHYTSSPQELAAFIDKYHVTLFVIGRGPLRPRKANRLRWFGEIAPATEFVAPTETSPVLEKLAEQHKIWENKTTRAIDARALVQTLRNNETSP